MLKFKNLKIKAIIKIMDKKEISIIAPCFNEANSVKAFHIEIVKIINDLNMSYEIIFINDGSTDNTFTILLQLKNMDKNIRILNLSRNFGKESALTAGLDYAIGEVIVPIDTDLQHPPALIKEFIKYHKEGYDVVLAKRADRDNSFLKNITTNSFYNLHNKISKVKVPKDVGDYRLITKKVLEAIKTLPENQRFMKGIFAFVGFKTKTIEYLPRKRYAGKSSFNSWKLWNFAIDGITNFSTIPLRIWLYLGSFISFISFLYGSFIVLKTLFLGIETPGYASMITVSLFLGGIQLMGIGILGEYIGRIYFEVKKRPSYIVENEY